MLDNAVQRSPPTHFGIENNAGNLTRPSIVANHYRFIIQKMSVDNVA